MLVFLLLNSSIKSVITSNKPFNDPIKIVLNCSCCECTWFSFVHSKVYWGTYVMLLIHRPGKKCIICIWCKVLIKVQQPLIKVPTRTYWNISKHTIVRFTLRKKVRKCLFFAKFIIQNRNWCFSLTWCNENIFLIDYIRNLRDQLQFCACLSDLLLKHILFHLHFHYYFCSFIFHPKYHFQ